jgi:ParB family chromosome partitioning protein
MAKRKRLTPPSDEALSRIDAGFSRSPERPTGGPLRPIAPIAAIAAEAAAQSEAEDPTTRADAERYRKALADGMMVEALALDHIAADDILRDRAVIDADEMAELKTSIATHGLRLPIEVYPITEPNKGFSYGLISGWRRLTALRELRTETGDPRYGTIKALIRKPDSAADAYISMVEENEIRADISQYERGRIAVLAAEQGAFDSYSDAVGALFASGSKAKRSKIRSFALLHETLGDVLRFPAALSERQGLQLAGMVKAGQGGRLRDALAQAHPGDATDEWALLEGAVKPTQPTLQPKPSAPRTAPTPHSRRSLPQGVSLIHERNGTGHVLRLEGAGVTEAFMEDLLDHIRKQLG